MSVAMIDPNARRLNLASGDFAELALRLQSKQPQLRAISQRQLAALVLLQVTKAALAETTDKLMAQGRFADQKLKDQFMAMRKTKEEAERTIEFYQAAGNALSVLFLSALPTSGFAAKAGKQMLELGDEWERCRADKPRADVIRLLLRDLSYTILDLPLTPQQGGADITELREKRLSEALERARLVSLEDSTPFGTGSGIVYLTTPNAMLASESEILAQSPDAAGSARTSIMPLGHGPAPLSSSPPGRALSKSAKPVKLTRADLVERMATRTAQIRRSGVPLIKPIAEKKKRSKNFGPSSKRGA